MTPEQIKVLEELRDDGVLAGCIDVEEQKALTAALEFIEDMREIEAAANKVTIKVPHYGSVSFYREEHGWWPTTAPTACIYDSLREAFKSVKGGKD